LRAGVEAVEQGDDRLLVGDGDVAAAPFRIGAAPAKETGELGGGNASANVIAFDPQPFEPGFMDDRRFRLDDRIADDFGEDHQSARFKNAATSTRSTEVSTKAPPMPCARMKAVRPSARFLSCCMWAASR